MLDINNHVFIIDTHCDKKMLLNSNKLVTDVVNEVNYLSMNRFMSNNVYKLGLICDALIKLFVFIIKDPYDKR